MVTNKKVCFFTHFSLFSKIGGAEVKSHYFASHLSNKKWEVHHIARDNSQSGIEKRIHGGYVTYRIPRLLHFRYFFDFQYIQLIHRIDPDIFYFRHDSPYNFITWIYARLFGKKFVFANTSDLHIDHLRNTRIALQAKFKTRPLAWLLILIENYIHDVTLNFSIRHCDACVVETSHQNQGFISSYGVKPVIIKGAHPVCEAPAQKARPSTILWVANLRTLKRPELFIQLAQRCQDLPARFIMIGGQSPPGYKDRLLSQAVGLTEFLYLDEIGLEESNHYFEEASIYVNTSEYESIANTFIQAWMRRTVTVSLSVDPDQVIERYQLGFHSVTFEQLVTDVRRLISNEELRTEMGMNARQYALQEHNIERNADKLIQLFNRLLEDVL